MQRKWRIISLRIICNSNKFFYATPSLPILPPSKIYQAVTCPRKSNENDGKETETLIQKLKKFDISKKFWVLHWKICHGSMPQKMQNVGSNKNDPTWKFRKSHNYCHIISTAAKMDVKKSSTFFSKWPIQTYQSNFKIALDYFEIIIACEKKYKKRLSLGISQCKFSTISDGTFGGIFPIFHAKTFTKPEFKIW